MPAPYRRIACFVEDSPAAEAAQAEALALRAQSPGELRLVHVAAPPMLMLTGPYGYLPTPIEFSEEARAWIEERAAAVPGATPVLLEGDPPRVACRWAGEEGIDLLVAAAHRGPVERTMLGGFAAHVAYHAPCPVLLVHPPAGGRGEGA